MGPMSFSVRGTDVQIRFGRNGQRKLRRVVFGGAPAGDFGHLGFLGVGEGLVGTEDLSSDEVGEVFDSENSGQVVESGLFGLVDGEVNGNVPVAFVVVVSVHVDHVV